MNKYDAPLAAAHTYGYYKPMFNFVRALLTAVLKDNKFLERGFLTGILYTAKEDILSELTDFI